MYYKDKSKPNRFLECRLEKKLTQEELASLLGIKRRAVMDHEKGRTLPNMSILLKMHQVLHVSLDYMLCLDAYRNHIEYADQVLGINKHLLKLLSSIEDKNQISRINHFIKIHYREYHNEKKDYTK